MLCRGTREPLDHRRLHLRYEWVLGSLPEQLHETGRMCHRGELGENVASVASLLEPPTAQESCKCRHPCCKGRPATSTGKASQSSIPQHTHSHKSLRGRSCRQSPKALNPLLIFARRHKSCLSSKRHGLSLVPDHQSPLDPANGTVSINAQSKGIRKSHSDPDPEMPPALRMSRLLRYRPAAPNSNTKSLLMFESPPSLQTKFDVLYIANSVAGHQCASLSPWRRPSQRPIIRGEYRWDRPSCG